MLEAGVESFLRVELRAVAGQVEQFDLVRVLGNPGFDGLAGVFATKNDSDEKTVANV